MARPGVAIGKAVAIIAHRDAAARLADKAVQLDGAALAASEGVLEGVGQQFVDHQPGGHGDIDRDRPGIDLEIEPDALHGVRLHHRCGDLAEIGAEIDRIGRPVVRERAIEQTERIDASGKTIEALGGGIIRDAARFEADQRRDHLQVVLHPVLQLAQQHVGFLGALFQLLLAGPLGACRQCHQPEHR